MIKVPKYLYTVKTEVRPSSDTPKVGEIELTITPTLLGWVYLYAQGFWNFLKGNENDF